MDLTHVGILGIQAYYKLGGFQLFFQYQVSTEKDVFDSLSNSYKDAPVSEILGFTYNSETLYGRVEYDLSDENNSVHQRGVRVGYNLGSEFRWKLNIIIISKK